MQHLVLNRRQLDLFECPEDISPLIHEASSVLSLVLSSKYYNL